MVVLIYRRFKLLTLLFTNPVCLIKIIQTASFPLRHFGIEMNKV